MTMTTRAYVLITVDAGKAEPVANQLRTISGVRLADVVTGSYDVIAVDDIKTAAKNVRDAGGNVLGEPMEIPGVGKYVSFTDPEGNRVSMLQPMHGHRA